MVPSTRLKKACMATRFRYDLEKLNDSAVVDTVQVTVSRRSEMFILFFLFYRKQ